MNGVTTLEGVGIFFSMQHLCVNEYTKGQSTPAWFAPCIAGLKISETIALYRSLSLSFLPKNLCFFFSFSGSLVSFAELFAC